MRSLTSSRSYPMSQIAKHATQLESITETIQYIQRVYIGIGVEQAISTDTTVQPMYQQ